MKNEMNGYYHGHGIALVSNLVFFPPPPFSHSYHIPGKQPPEFLPFSLVIVMVISFLTPFFFPLPPLGSPTECFEISRMLWRLNAHYWTFSRFPVGCLRFLMRVSRLDELPEESANCSPLAPWTSWVGFSLTWQFKTVSRPSSLRELDT